MTKEEAIDILWGKRNLGKQTREAIEMAIKALEQESSDDTISRKAVIEQINSWISNGEYSYTNATYYLKKRIRDIPPVIPQSDELKTLKEEVKVMRENKGVLEQLAEEQNSLLASTKAWSDVIEKNRYVN